MVQITTAFDLRCFKYLWRCFLTLKNKANNRKQKYTEQTQKIVEVGACHSQQYTKFVADKLCGQAYDSGKNQQKH